MECVEQHPLMAGHLLTTRCISRAPSSFASATLPTLLRLKPLYRVMRSGSTAVLRTQMTRMSQARFNTATSLTDYKQMC